MPKIQYWQGGGQQCRTGPPPTVLAGINFSGVNSKKQFRKMRKHSSETAFLLFTALLSFKNKLIFYSVRSPGY